MWVTVVTLFVVWASARGEDSCVDRCTRIQERSLNRIGYSIHRASNLIEKGRGERLREVCWKSYDYFYCIKGCKKTNEQEKIMRRMKNKCKSVMEDMQEGLSCLYKYRNFLEIRCSSFMNEAIRLKKEEDPQFLPDKETCRFLHLNALCLENSVGSFCPSASFFFRRIHLRDFFLNHLLPFEDELFDDQDLDYCQMKDFVKEALEGIGRSQEILPSSPRILTLSPSRTSTTSTSSSNFHVTSPIKRFSSSPSSIHVSKDAARQKHTWTTISGGNQKITVVPSKGSLSSTRVKVKTTPSSVEVESEDEVTTHSGRRKIFESQEDLAFTPPNFFYSSFRGGQWKDDPKYSHSFPHDTSFITPVHIDTSTIFGYDESDESNEKEKKTNIMGAPIVVRNNGEVKDENDIYVIDHNNSATLTPHIELFTSDSTTIHSHTVDTPLPTLDTSKTTVVVPETLTRIEEDENEGKKTSTFTPLINGGRISVKSIKSFKEISETNDYEDDEESMNEWNENESQDEYENELYITSEVDTHLSSNILTNINSFHIQIFLFFLLSLLILLCLCYLLYRRRRKSQHVAMCKLNETI